MTAGSGLGFPSSRWGVEATNGRVYARNLPDPDAFLSSIYSAFHFRQQASHTRRRVAMDRRFPSGGLVPAPNLRHADGTARRNSVPLRMVSSCARCSS